MAAVPYNTDRASIRSPGFHVNRIALDYAVSDKISEPVIFVQLTFSEMGFRNDPFSVSFLPFCLSV